MAKRATGLSESKTAVAERERQAVELWKAGLTYEDIARQVGWADSESARKAILRVINRNTISDLDERRSQHLARLEGMYRALAAKIARGDEKAIEAALKILAQERKYIGGLEVPAQMDVTVEHTDSDTFSKQLDAYLQGKADAYEQEKA